MIGLILFPLYEKWKAMSLCKFYFEGHEPNQYHVFKAYYFVTGSYHIV